MGPDTYLHHVDGGAGVFVPMDRASYHRSIFLDHRIQAAEAGETRAPLAAGPIQPTSFIFHVAHCGSTLLARALDRLDGNLVLREPMALRQAALDGKIALEPVMASLSRRYRADLPTMIKANVPVNFILPRLIDAVPGMRALFLNMPLDTWLTAVLRSPQHRDWVNQVSALVGLPPADDNATAAAQLWLAQTDAFRAAMALLPDSVSLNAETFFADPEPALQASAAALKIEMPEIEAVSIAAGPLFRHDAKRPANAFGNADRMHRASQIRATIAPEIAAAKNWIEARGGDQSPLPTAVI